MAIFHSYVKLPEGKLHCRHLSLGFFNEGLQQSNHWIVFATSVTVTPGIECPTLTKPFHWFSQSQTRDGSKFVWWDSQEAPTFCLLSMSNCFGKILTHHKSIGTPRRFPRHNASDAQGVTCESWRAAATFWEWVGKFIGPKCVDHLWQ